MRSAVCSLLLVAFLNVLASAASVREEDLTTRELAEALGLSVQKVVFTFDSPVYAKVDLVTVKEGQAVHSPSTTSEPRAEVPFHYVFHGYVNPGAIQYRIGNGTNISADLRAFNSPSAVAHRVYPELKLPATVDPATPIYVFIDWDPLVKNAGLNPKMPPDQIVSGMTQGYYMVLYFSETPFK